MRQTAIRHFISRVHNARPLGMTATAASFSMLGAAATTASMTAAAAATPAFAGAAATSSPASPSTSNFYFNAATARRHFTGGRSKNPYKVIGVPQGASKEDIKKAYRILARKNHPDAPGGSHEKFQEIQQAYEQIKTGVYIPKEGEGGAAGGGGGGGNTFAGFKFTTATSKGKVSYDEFMKEMHTGREAEGSEDTGPQSAAAREAKARMGANDVRIQAWFRLLSLWATVFLTLRVTMMLLFPRRAEKKLRAPPAARVRKEPPPPAAPRPAIAA